MYKTKKRSERHLKLIADTMREIFEEEYEENKTYSDVQMTKLLIERGVWSTKTVTYLARKQFKLPRAKERTIINCARRAKERK